ncbi:DUF4331 domain-containing protein [Undibacterium sp. RTI2.1]|uniref:DUF4331 domain-containing protein n=1 Tax=unclassified Undibacterium TaxID=2630295 RepID=UPI002AB343C3|nr:MULTISPECIES: DUF4331 domain-containing protein [unclassified Undibacterium]MDY7540001.1 DUF4331 domain-containing protein [Undibacterium sp. 5I1]MEB0032827.1 DUF4331 domain-containing protein [Undibacterium sp. RTI2.1]MEB0116513.1 DUF4331 domain-containing protein [Undibacterium sp. RTI2.2]MEB0232360.1 DUF4331 domain-containing protein [Undibacterium sp. 10I3]MEB0257848.1 DUF4331 domain-containing protein [Undibacterium sp. 5I1]
MRQISSKLSNKALNKVLLSVIAAGSLSSIATLPAQASSHREAPFITRHPKVDGTDFYMFRSYEANRGAFTTLIANYAPLQDAYGGPNYFSMDPDALYEIHIDNVGDGKEHLTFQFRFTNTNKDAQFTVGGKKVSIPLVINGGAIDGVNPAGLNVRETYTITMVTGDRRTGTRQAVVNSNGGAASFDKPIDNIGNKSIPNYASYAAQHVFNINIPGCATPGRVFVGQRKDPFVVNLGETFDLINIQYPATAFNANAEKAGHDDLANKNVTSIEMEVPTACLTSGTEPVIGGWTTASLRQGRVINPTPNSSTPSKEGGAWTQVSRLGMPLVNEVVIGLKDKDQFNHSKPSGDGQFLTYVTNPTLPALVEVLYGSAGVKAPTNFPRNDLVAAFLTGIKGVNQPANVVASEMLRLNTTTPVSATQNRLGVIGGDSAGFPNGRRPGDDVVDIALRVVMGRLCILNIGCVPTDAPAGSIDFTDGAYLDSSFFDNSFPYLKTPIAGSLKH